jgi:hypothetical protein
MAWRKAAYAFFWMSTSLHYPLLEATSATRKLIVSSHASSLHLQNIAEEWHNLCVIS